MAARIDAMMQDAAELAQYPLSGAIFSLRTDVAGLHKPKFKENQS